MRLVALALTLVATIVTAADRPTIQNVFYIENYRVFALSLDLRVAKQSLESAWKQSVKQYFEHHDSDSDGALNGGEVTGLPTVAELSTLLGVSTTSIPSADFRPRDGKVTLIELTSWLKLMGAGAFSVQGSTMASNEASPAFDFFAELDQNADQRLSAAEIAQLAGNLKKFDIDDDESLSRTELRPFEPAPQMMRAAPNQPAPSKPTLLAATSASERRALVNMFLQRFDDNAAGAKSEPDSKLTNAEFGVTKEVFESHDLDSDGRLDYEELGQFVRRPKPSVSLTFQLDESTDQRVTITDRSGDAQLTKTESGRWVLSLGETELDLSVHPLSKVNTESTQKEFAAADSDNNAYLDQKEIGKATQLRGLHRLLDSNNDGNVFAEEFAQFAKSRSLLKQSRIVLSAEHRGFNLFDIVDSNKNGRISFNELDTAIKLLASWDIDKDGSVTKSELPRNYRLTIAPSGTVRLNGARAETNTANAPVWFNRMDRNQDGEITLREFVGPLTFFERHDRNGDGLLSAHEITN